ncbi:MAG TPA: efflux RND transporter periplasmic adaptor subunit [Candidatus Paceibacterota bacterium]|jgi:RND family efflux transporter MFP subunit|nr:efflux RND transporter periplasmic adaptor subunit [Candidatus Paceibacterota bacterium]
MLTRFKGYLTPPVIITTAAVLAVASAALVYFMSGSKPAAAFVSPTMGSLTEQVDTTGSVQAADEINLGFQAGGTVSDAGPAVGTHVAQGVTLGTLRSGTQRAAVEQAEAALETQQANLSNLQEGARPEQVSVSQTSVSNAQASLTQAKQALIAAAEDAYAKSDDAIVNKVDQFMLNPHSINPSLAFSLTNSEDQTSIVSGRLQMEALLSGWQQYLASIPSDPNAVDTDALASTTRANLQAVSAYLNLVATGLTEAVPSTGYTMATIQAYETNVATGRTNVSADLTALATAQTALTTAQSGLASAQSQLSLTTAPATSQQIQAQEGQVAAAQAQVDAAQALLSQTVITAPISGTITVNNMEPGQVAAAGQTQVTMISDTKFQFEAYVSETQLSELKVGEAGQVELDAYEDQPPLPTHVIAIDPAATIQNGVASYKVTVQFDQNDPRISSGETGSATITAQSLDNVMSIPASAIIMDNGQYFVIKKAGSGTLKVPVQIGIEGANGYTQITSGLSPSDQIQTFGSQ